MKIFGITGGTGTGKTTAMKAFQQLGGIAIDADVVYHKLLEESKEMIAEIEGTFPGVVEGGVLDRKKLGEIVFNDKEKLTVLNKITHKYIGEEIKRMVKSAQEDGAEFLAIDGVEIIESGYADMCDTLIAVNAPLKSRITRIMSREGISMGYAAMRIAAQKPDSYYEQHCDVTLWNDFKTGAEFEEHCLGVFRNLMGV